MAPWQKLVLAPGMTWLHETQLLKLRHLPIVSAKLGVT
jgi:hypothetical protein